MEWRSQTVLFASLEKLSPMNNRKEERQDSLRPNSPGNLPRWGGVITDPQRKLKSQEVEEIRSHTALGWVVSNSSDQECIRAEMYLMGGKHKNRAAKCFINSASPTLSAGEVTHKNLVLMPVVLKVRRG